MSLQLLLSQYPNYSARKVRSLAKQLQYLSVINSKEAKCIAADLQAYHLQSAQIEQQLNEDAVQFGGTEEVLVTPIHEAFEALDYVIKFGTDKSRISEAKVLITKPSFVVCRLVQEVPDA